MTEPTRAAIPRVLAHTVLALVLVYGAGARLARKDFGLPYLHHWDEPSTANGAMAILKTGDFNPHNFHYTSLLLYTCVAVDLLHYYDLMTLDTASSDYLGTIDNLTLSDETGYQWTVSHPSFYAADRTLIALLGTLTILLAFALVRDRWGPIAGLVGAFLVATTPAHVIHSTYVTPTVPLTFLATATVLACVRHHRSPTLLNLAGSAALFGLCMSIKFSIAPLFLSLLLALAFDRKHAHGAPAWCIVALVPAIVFVACNPFALIDFAAFVRDTGYEVHHYRVLGHAGAEVTPGMPHLLRVASYFRREMGAPLLLASLVGALAALRQRAGWIMLSGPTAYLLYMAQQHASFERNFVVGFPFLAVTAGVTIATAWDAAAPHGRWTAPARLATLLVLLALLARPDRTLRDAWTAGHSPDTRSQAVDRLVSLADVELRGGGGARRHLRGAADSPA